MASRQASAAAARILGRPGKAALEAMMSGELPQPNMAVTLGFSLVEVGDGRVVFEGTPGEKLLNPLGTVHGGFALTMIDSAAACAAHTTLPANVGYTTVETKCNFTRAIIAESTSVRCEGRVVAAGKRIITAEAYVRQGDKLVAHGTSTIMVLEDTSTSSSR